VSGMLDGSGFCAFTQGMPVAIHPSFWRRRKAAVQSCLEFQMLHSHTYGTAPQRFGTV
jgi:hypothetical protein